MKAELECRVCRSGTEENTRPLFSPCNCSGSIGLVHQDCLESWLYHSHKESCEICGKKYIFKPVYASNTPSRIPFHIILKSSLTRIIFVGLPQVAFYISVGVWWLVFVPMVTSISFRRLISGRDVGSKKITVQECVQGLVLFGVFLLLDIAKVTSLHFHFVFHFDFFIVDIHIFCILCFCFQSVQLFCVLCCDQKHHLGLFARLHEYRRVVLRNNDALAEPLLQPQPPLPQSQSPLSQPPSLHSSSSSSSTILSSSSSSLSSSSSFSSSSFVEVVVDDDNSEEKNVTSDQEEMILKNTNKNLVSSKNDVNWNEMKEVVEESEDEAEVKWRDEETDIYVSNADHVDRLELEVISTEGTTLLDDEKDTEKQSDDEIDKGEIHVNGNDHVDGNDDNKLGMEGELHEEFLEAGAEAGEQFDFRRIGIVRMDAGNLGHAWSSFISSVFQCSI